MKSLLLALSFAAYDTNLDGVVDYSYQKVGTTITQYIDRDFDGFYDFKRVNGKIERIHEEITDEVTAVPHVSTFEKKGYTYIVCNMKNMSRVFKVNDQNLEDNKKFFFFKLSNFAAYKDFFGRFGDARSIDYHLIEKRVLDTFEKQDQ